MLLSLLDVRVYWGADAASDRHLVLAGLLVLVKIKMTLKRVKITPSTRPWVLTIYNNHPAGNFRHKH